MSAAFRFIHAAARGERRRSERYPVRLPCSITLLEAGPESDDPPTAFFCHTRDVSTEGLAVAVPRCEIDELNLAGADRRLRIFVNLPDGQVELHCGLRRYVPFQDKYTAWWYLLGVEIDWANESARAAYESFITSLGDSGRE